MDGKKNNYSGILQAMAVVSMIGVELAVTVTLGFFAGNALDHKFSTEPWLLVTGVLLGLAVGVWGIISTISRFLK